MIDKTGEPRSSEDIQEAISAIEETLVNFATAPLSTKLLVMLPTIRESLKELLDRRKND